MLTIILSIALGIIFTLIASENSQPITLSLFGSFVDLPLYIFLAISFLAGTLITSIFSIFDWTFTAFDLKKKEDNFRQALRLNENLRKDIVKLNNENASLRNELNEIKSGERDKKSQQRKENIRNFWYRITHPGSYSESHLVRG